MCACVCVCARARECGHQVECMDTLLADTLDTLDTLHALDSIPPPPPPVAMMELDWLSAVSLTGERRVLVPPHDGQRPISLYFN